MRHTMHTGVLFRSSIIAALVSALCSGAAVQAASATGDVLSLTVAQDYTYDSNVFRVADNVTPVGYSHRSDSIWATRGKAALDKEIGRQRFTASLGGSYNNYNDFNTLDNTGYDIQAGWRMGFGTASEVGLSYNKVKSLGRFEDRTNTFRKNMVTYESIAGDAAIRVAGDWLGVASVAQGAYENSEEIFKSGDSYSRSYDGGVRYAPRNGNYVDVRLRKSDFEYNRVFSNTVDYSYDQKELRLTGRWVANGASTFEPGVAYVRSRHDEAAYMDFSGVTWFLNYTWKPSAALNSSLKVARDVGAVGDAWGSYARTYGLYSYTNWQTTAKLGFLADLAWQDQDYRGYQSLTGALTGAERADQVWWVRVGGNYRVTERFLVELSAKTYRRMSSQAAYTFNDKQVLATAQYKF